jgi:phytoene dehydrogenase-like protein
MDAVIGAGMGGLCAAIALARAGRRVTVFEASEQVGGLAGRVVIEGRAMDGGPYILLDRPGLEWAFEQLGERLDAHVDLIPLDETWRVTWPDGQEVRILRDLHETAAGLDRSWPGAGARYVRFVRRMTDLYERLAPLQRDHHSVAKIALRPDRWAAAPFLLRPLGAHLAATGLPARVQHALGIWTHIANQPLAGAPSPLAFVPAIVHSRGAFVARGGVHRIPEALLRIAREHGVDVRFGAPVERIRREGDVVRAIVVDGQEVDVDRVVSNAPGVSTYTRLLHPPDVAMNAELEALPLQSPGVAAYLVAGRTPEVPFLRFLLPDDGPCRLLVHFGAVDPDRADHARLLVPLDHGWATDAGRAGQDAFLDRVLAEPWWRAGLVDPRVVGRRLPVDWGRRHRLERDSMNPVMTHAFMRQGRLPHQSPVARNLLLAGSATHPGQWVSFCAVSGVLAARRALAAP